MSKTTALRWTSLCLLGLLHTALAISARDMKDYVKLEHELVKNFAAYAKELQYKIDVITIALDEYKEEVEEAKADPELYLSNPLNAFKLIRHMHQDWLHWQQHMEQQLSPELEEQLQLLLLRAPKRSAFKEALQELLSNIKFYDYAPSKLAASGTHLGTTNMIALDFYHVGLELYRQHNYLEAIEWLEVAAQNYSSMPFSELGKHLGVAHWQVFELLAKVLQKLDRYPEALEAIEKALLLEPYNVKLKLELGKLELLVLREPTEPWPESAVISSDLEQKCRGNLKLNSELLCEHNNYVTPFLEMAPFRMEELLFDPYVLLYHSGIYDSEIQHLKHAYEGCPDAVKFSGPSGVVGCSVSDRYSPITKRIAARLMDMTGMEKPMKGLHLMQYGLTKPFKIFEVFKQSSKFFQLDYEEIETTVIMFLNDVPLGGAITIPNFNIAVIPRKGDAIVTVHEGEFDHTVCPNVVGTGFVLVKFFYTEALD